MSVYSIRGLKQYSKDSRPESGLEGNGSSFNDFDIDAEMELIMQNPATPKKIIEGATKAAKQLEKEVSNARIWYNEEQKRVNIALEEMRLKQIEEERHDTDEMLRELEREQVDMIARYKAADQEFIAGAEKLLEEKMKSRQQREAQDKKQGKSSMEEQTEEITFNIDRSLEQVKLLSAKRNIMNWDHDMQQLLKELEAKDVPTKKEPQASDWNKKTKSSNVLMTASRVSTPGGKEDAVDKKPREEDKQIEKCLKHLEDELDEIDKLMQECGISDV